MDKTAKSNIDTLLNDLETLHNDLEELKNHSAVKQSQRGKLATTILSCQNFLNEVAPLLRQLEEQEPANNEKIKEELLEQVDFKIKDIENTFNEKFKSLEDLIGGVKDDKEYQEKILKILEGMNEEPKKTGIIQRFKQILKSV